MRQAQFIPSQIKLDHLSLSLGYKAYPVYLLTTHSLQPTTEQLNMVSASTSTPNGTHINGANGTTDAPLSKPVPNLLEGPLSPIASTRFRQLLARPGIIVRPTYPQTHLFLTFFQAAPGICDGISARCALEAGFEVLYQRYA